MTDLRLFNAIEEQQKQQEIQQSSLMQKAAEQVQQQQELSPEIQGIVDRVQQQNEREAIRRRLNNFYTEAAQYASGGGIHIDPSKKGTFTAAASRHGMGVQEFASHVHAHPENYSPAMRRKANFARNAAKWHHGYGGPLNCFSLGDNITIADLPREYVDAHRNMTVRTPSGNAVPLSEAYSRYGATPVNVNDVPGLTDYLITQEQPEIAMQGEINRAQQHRLNQEFNRQVDNFFMGNWTRPSQILGAFNPFGSGDGIPFSQRLFLGTGNTGIVSPEFTEAHPYLAEGANLLFDIALPGAVSGVPEMYNAARYNPYTLSRSMNIAARKNSAPSFIVDYASNPVSTTESAPTRVFPNMKQYFNDPAVFAEYKQKVLDAYSGAGAAPTNEMVAASNVDDLAKALPRKSQLSQEQFDAINEAFRNGRLQRKYYYSDAMKDRLYDFVDKNGNPYSGGVERLRQRYINGGKERLQQAADEAYQQFLGTKPSSELRSIYDEAIATSDPIVRDFKIKQLMEERDLQRLENGLPLLESGLNTKYRPLDIQANAGEAIGQIGSPHASFTVGSSAVRPGGLMPEASVRNFVERSEAGIPNLPYSFQGEAFVNPSEIEGLIPEGGDLYAALEDAATHESGHLMMPTTYSSPTGFNLKALSKYLKHNGYTELVARGSQIKNYLERLGVWKEGQPITGDMLKMTAERYPKEVMNNNMTDMFNAITDWNAAARWFTKFAPATAGAAALGIGAVNSDAYGGPLNIFAPGGTMSHQNGMIKSILDKYLSNYRITSGYRGPNNKVGKLGNKSAHASLLDDGSSAALDIVSDDMNRLREELANPALQRELAAAGFGILDETDPVTMKKTGATGAHFHIGQGIKGGGFHLNGYGYQPGYASADYPARGGKLQPIVTGGGTDDSGFTPWWTRSSMTDADMESLYASAAGNVPEPETMDFSQFNLDWSPNTASYPNLLAKGGFTSSPAIRSQIAQWEGSSMYKPAPDTGKVNRPFSAEERDFWNAIPDDVKPYLTQEMADALFSTSYNIGAGNFKKRVVPKLRSVLVNHQGTVEDITSAMYGTRDSEPKMKGLRTRRAAERQMFTDAYNRAYGEGGTSSYAGVGYGYGEPIMISQNDSQQEQFTPWWQQSAMTDEDLEALYSSAAGQVPDATPDFAQFNLGWDPVRGRHTTTSPVKYPKLFALGGFKDEVAN